MTGFRKILEAHRGHDLTIGESPTHLLLVCTQCQKTVMDVEKAQEPCGCGPGQCLAKACAIPAHQFCKKA